MTILALESSASAGSVALVRGGVVVAEKEFASPRGRGGEMFPALEEILAVAPGVERVAVGLGPGSYNGIRSAVAAGWGIATARAVPMVGVSSLLALAEGAYLAVGDARGGQYYLAEVDAGRFVREPELYSPDGLLAAVKQAGGLPAYCPAPLQILDGAEVKFPRASLLAGLAERMTPGGEIPEPLYLKPPKITEPRGSRRP